MRFEVLVVLIVGGSAAACHRPQTTPIRSSYDWLATQEPNCGEVVGRVIDARDGAPVPSAFVSIDTTAQAARLDSLGQFRVSIAESRARTRPTPLRIRRLGALEIRTFLPSHLAYVVEIRSEPQGLHMDGVSTVRVRALGSCTPAT